MGEKLKVSKNYINLLIIYMIIIILIKQSYRNILYIIHVIKHIMIDSKYHSHAYVMQIYLLIINYYLNIKD